MREALFILFLSAEYVGGMVKKSLTSKDLLIILFLNLTDIGEVIPSEQELMGGMLRR